MTKIQEQDNMKASIRLLKEQGYSAPKQLFRILLLALSPLWQLQQWILHPMSLQLPWWKPPWTVRLR